MFDNADEDKDLPSQISKNPKESEAKEGSESKPVPASAPVETKQDEKASEEKKD
jgi:protein phosphatase 2C family protein 2/3